VCHKCSLVLLCCARVCVHVCVFVCLCVFCLHRLHALYSVRFKSRVRAFLCAMTAEKDASRAIVWDGLGQAQCQMGLHDEANVSFARAVALKPEVCLVAAAIDSEMSVGFTTLPSVLLVILLPGTLV
jgi:hypothetical protein